MTGDIYITCRSFAYENLRKKKKKINDSYDFFILFQSWNKV